MSLATLVKSRLSSPDSVPASDENHAGPGVAKSVLALQAQLDEAHGRIALQSDSALQAVLSEREMAAERRVSERIRAAERRQRERAAMAATAREGARTRAQERIVRAELKDQLWHAAALSRRQRLLDPSSRLAAVYRGHSWTSRVLIALIVAGVAWTAVNVQDTLSAGVSVTDPMFWLGFVVEPLISIPLIVLMNMQTVAARWGRKFDSDRANQILGLEIGLLALTVFLNSVPYLPLFGQWKSLPLLVGHMVPPILIAIVVIQQPIVSAFYAGILRDAHVETTSPAGSRLTDETADVLVLVTRVREAMASGDLPPAEDSPFPSITAIQRYLAVGKQRAQATHDALRMLYGRRPNSEETLHAAA